MPEYSPQKGKNNKQFTEKRLIVKIFNIYQMLIYTALYL